MPKKLIRALGLVAMIGSTIFFLRALVPHLGKLVDVVTDRATLVAIFGALVIYVFVFAVMGTAWWVLVRSAGLQLPWHRCVSIFNVSQMGKYLPGNFMQHIGRVTLAQREGLPATAIMLTSLWELVGVLLAGAMISLVTLGLSPALLQVSPASGQRIAFLALATGGLLAVSVVLFRWVQHKYAGVQRRGIVPALLGCCLAYLVVFFLHGLSLHWIALASNAESNLFIAVGVFALAWIAGFVTPGAVGGIGVRETVLLLGLTPICGEDNAVSLAVAMRFVSTLGDGVAFVIGLWLGRRAS